MFGTVINNKRIQELRDVGKLAIQPFDVEKLDSIHYPLYPSELFCASSDGGRKNKKFLCSVSEGDEGFVFEGGQYVLVKVRELVVVKSGIVAQFASPFHLVDSGFGLFSGRLEAPFGEEGQHLVFGIKNLLDNENFLHFNKPVAYIYFIDISGLNNLKVELTEEEISKFKKWNKRYGRALDDGPFYDDEYSNKQKI